MKKINICLTVFLYLMQLFVGIIPITLILTYNSGLIDPLIPIIIGLVFLVVVIVFWLINIYYVVKESCKKTSDCFKTMMIFKLIQIPFYILNFCLCAIIVAGLLNPFLAWSIIFVVPFAVMMTYLLMLSTSSYIVIRLIREIKRKELRISKIWLHIILQFCFVADVIDSIILNAKYNKMIAS